MPIIPTFEEVNAHIEAVEEFVASHLPNVPDLPPVLSQVWGRIHEDLMRFGPPSMPALPASITGIRDVFVEVPPSSHRPVTRIPVGQKASSWLSRNKWSVLGVALGSGLLAGYLITSSGDQARSRPRFRLLARKKKRTNDLTSERREIILLLGADHPFGLGLARDLVSRGYVVIASVSRAELADELESHGAGFIRAIVLNPTDPATLNPFLRDMRATLGLRFPLGSAGDPYASPASHAHIVALVSLLSLATTDPENVTEQDATSFMPLSSMSLTKDYLPLLISSHVTPFGIIQGVLPHLRNTNKYLPKSHPSVVILQSVYTLGPGRNGADAIVTTANTTALDVFRRELREQGVDVFELDIGKIDPAGVVPLGMKRREAARRERHASQVGRTPSSFEVLADAVADVVGERGVVQWWRGSKRPVGAGARTYTLASHLPTRVLDILISLPRTLVAMRNSGPTIGVPPGNNSTQPPRIQTTLPPRPEADSTQPSAVTPSSSLLSQSSEPSPADEMHHSHHSYNVPAGEVWDSVGETEPDSWVSLSGRGTPSQV
ncbi:unnamed protein product [Rhizoctonia solani]|uniref:Uncharacterized protein n=1 Tax=Rhizoctonia solani TaxID=456999 RepID=A0A8H2XX46_9AGAM|nr:unnamed protein product [Rhizoctonia solani]